LYWVQAAWVTLIKEIDDQCRISGQHLHCAFLSQRYDISV
jgi:hypothetical protein